MCRRPARALCATVAVLAAGLLGAVPAAQAAAGACGRHGDEVRFDDGRLLVERSVRDVTPTTVRERWWTCWRPTGRRVMIVDRRHHADVDEEALTAVRRGRFVVLAGAARIDVYDGRGGRLTATVPQRGAIREVAVSVAGRVAVIQDAGKLARVLWAGAGTTSCLLDAGPPLGRNGAPFGLLRIDGEHLRWFRDDLAFGSDLSALSCPDQPQ